MANGMTVPAKKKFFVPEVTKDKLIAVAQMSATSPQNVLVKGKQGMGKSELAEQFAASLKRPFASFSVGILAESGQLFGQQTLKDNNVTYQQFLFTDALQVNNAVILLDEINRAENPKALNALFSVLDDRRFIWLDEVQKRVDVANGVVFFATINEGAEFTGIDLLDAAISDRFYTIEMGVLPVDQELNLLKDRAGVDDETAGTLIAIINKARVSDTFVSTRKAIDVAKLVSTGLGIRSSFEFALGLEKQKLESILLSIHLSQDQDEVQSTDWTTLD